MDRGELFFQGACSRGYLVLSTSSIVHARGAGSGQHVGEPCYSVLTRGLRASDK